jgi:hypothetical protein
MTPPRHSDILDTREEHEETRSARRKAKTGAGMPPVVSDPEKPRKGEDLWTPNIEM